MIKLHPSGTHAIMSNGPKSEGCGAWTLTGEVILELVELARLALSEEYRDL